MAVHAQTAETSSEPFDLHARGDRIFGIVNTALLLLFVLSTLYPFVYILSASLSSGFAVTSGRVFLWPVEATFAAYEYVLSDRKFWVAYGNIFYALFGTLTSLLVMVPGAFALSRTRLRGRRLIGFMIAFTLWFHAGLIPFFLNVQDLGLLDTRIGIVVAFACNAFNVILLRNYFEAVPASFEESGADRRGERLPAAPDGVHSAREAGHRHGGAAVPGDALERLLLGHGAPAHRREDPLRST